MLAGYKPVRVSFSGHRLSNYVKLFEPTYKSSKYVYEEIRDNLDQLIEEAIDNSWKY